MEQTVFDAIGDGVTGLEERVEAEPRVRPLAAGLETLVEVVRDPLVPGFDETGRERFVVVDKTVTNTKADPARAPGGGGGGGGSTATG